MLRRKLIIVLGSLVALLLATAVGAIWLLQGLLGDLRHLDSEAWVVIEEANNLGTSISLVEIELYSLQLGRRRHLDALIDLVDTMGRQVAVIGKSYVAHLPENEPTLRRIGDALPVFASHVAGLGTAQDPQRADHYRDQALGTAISLRQDILALSRAVRSHGQAEQAEVIAFFRMLVLGLTVVFLLVLNVSIIALLRMAAMVVRPVEKLLEASRELGQENFDFRVDLQQNDEFDELALAYNNLAGQLQANEQRKLEMMGHVALTLNHELNNAIAIIDLQLQLLNRQNSGNTRVEKCAHEIHQSLARMTHTVDALKRVRRIVLTDYVAGVKMLDLERSVEEFGPPPPPAPPEPPQSRTS